METQNKQHPSALHLAALALGKLKADVAAKVQSHLEECSDCRRYISDTPRDALAKILSQARSKSAADQNTLATGLSGTVIGAPTVPLERSPSGAKAQTPLNLPASLTSNRVQHSVGENEIPHDLFAQSKYRIVRVLGRGGMGTVYEAEHVRMKRPVAIKVVNPELVNNPQALLRFEEEIKAVASLDHINIARAFDAENIGELQVFVMEFVRGQTLHEFLKSRGRLSVVDACRCVRQAFIGLQHAHQQGLVHRDLKPQNLMLTRDTGQIKILDFGLAKAVSENRQSRGLTNTRTTMGTYAYMAPEQALDAASADIRADIYSLGCTLYLLVAGVLPFDYDIDTKLLLAHQSETPRPLHEICPDVPQALSELVAKMLAKDQQDRPRTPREAADALLPFARGPSALAPATNESAVQRAAAGRGLNRWMWGGIAAAIFALFGFGGWAAGIFSIRTPHGTIVVEGVPDDANVTVDGQAVTFERKGDLVTIAAVEKGSHHLKLVQGGHEVWSDDVTVAMADQLVRVRFKPETPATEATADRSATRSNQPVTDRDDDEGFVSLFNGKDFTGWDGNLALWSVTDGTIVGRTTANAPIQKNTCLIWRGGEPRDFRLKLQYRLESGNSGVQYRSRVVDPQNWVVGGYQADIESGDTYSGVLYEELGRGVIALRGQNVTIASNGSKSLTTVADAAKLQKGIHTDEWNDYEIEARGGRLRQWINGKLMCEVEDNERAKRSESGVIALQLHAGPPMAVRFRYIMLKSLDADSTPSTSDSNQSTSDATSSTSEDGFTPLFNGKDLSGWTTMRKTLAHGRCSMEF